MTDIIHWLSGADSIPGSRSDLGWAWVTVALSVAIAAGYVVIAVNRHFQAKLARVRESRAAFARLRNIVLCSAVMGAVFYATDMFWLAWRLYDLVLLGLAVHTWLFAYRSRALALLDKRLAEAVELERLAGRYREIAESVPEIVWTATAAGGVDFSNRCWSDYVGDGRTWLEAIHPDERTRVLEWWERTVAERKPASCVVRLGGAGANGSGCRTFMVKATPVFHGGEVKWLGACADIEDQRRLAEERETLGRRKLFFLNALSHDLRAPLNNVVLNAHLLKAGAHDEAEAESAAAIVENARAAGDIVAKLLDFARVDRQERNVVERLSMAGALRQIVRRFVPVAEAKGLSLRIVAERDTELSTDRQKLERIVTNLVDNAIKFTDAGGVTVELLTRANGVGATVRVSDTGIGVPPEHAEHLFDEFYQVTNARRERGQGFGMGLAICRSLARQLGGDVRLAETVLGGACFEITLRDLDAGPEPEHAGALDAGDDQDLCFA